MSGLALIPSMTVACSLATATSPPPQPASSTNRIAFLGNSILYFNDVPRTLEALCLCSGRTLLHDCCLRGGATLTSLLAKGNGMKKLFATPKARRADGSFDVGAPTVGALLTDGAAAWDFVVMNDYTQGPARAESREESIQTLVEEYAPLLRACGATPVFVMTHAYRAHTKGSDDLGDTVSFTRRLRDGYHAYAAALAAALPGGQRPLVCPVGVACAVVHDERPQLWAALFHTDDFHLSPAGSLLQAACLHCTLFRGEALPPEGAADVEQLFARARYMQPPDHPPLALPTREEAAYLFEVAYRVVHTEEQTP